MCCSNLRTRIVRPSPDSSEAVEAIAAGSPAARPAAAAVSTRATVAVPKEAGQAVRSISPMWVASACGSSAMHETDSL
jgi:hypothetical protein